MYREDFEGDCFESRELIATPIHQLELKLTGPQDGQGRIGRLLQSYDGESEVNECLRESESKYEI